MNLHLYPSSFVSESRMRKEIESIVRLGISSQVVVLGVMSSGLLPHEEFAEKSKVIRLSLIGQKYIKGMPGKLINLLDYLFKSFMFCMRQNPNVINCHSLNVLGVGILYKLFNRNVRIIYDAHELETERAGLSGFAQIVSKWIEKYLIRFVDYVIVVCDPIRDWYQDAYGLKNISVIRNLPKKMEAVSKNDILRQNHRIPDDHLVFIYQGVLSEARGIFDLINVFKSVESNNHIVFMGYGPAEGEIISAAKNIPNIHFQPAVKPDEIICYTSGADVGIFFLAGKLSLSYQYSLPNKFFEYLYSGCPVVVSNSLIYLSDIVKAKRLGWSVASNHLELVNLINSISKQSTEKYRQNIKDYISDNFWEKDEFEYFKAFGVDSSSSVKHVGLP